VDNGRVQSLPQLWQQQGSQGCKKDACFNDKEARLGRQWIECVSDRVLELQILLVASLYLLESSQVCDFTPLRSMNAHFGHARRIELMRGVQLHNEAQAGTV
jgi:hypothetical protein